MQVCRRQGSQEIQWKPKEIFRYRATTTDGEVRRQGSEAGFAESAVAQNRVTVAKNIGQKSQSVVRACG